MNMFQYSQIKSVDLIEEIDQLKQILNHPEKYVWDYFYDLKNQIDLDFNKIDGTLKIRDDTKNDYVSTWTSLIDKLNDFKSKCIQNINLFKINLSNYIKEINELEDLINNEINRQSVFNLFTNKTKKIKNLKELIKAKNIDIKKKLFLNKTIFYMNRDKCNIYEKLNDIKTSNDKVNLPNLIGRLIIVQDYYLDNIDYINLFMK